MDTFTPNFDLDKWSPDKSDLTRWYYELAKFLSEHPIPSEDNVDEIIAKYLTEHPIEGAQPYNGNPAALEATPRPGGSAAYARGDHVHQYPKELANITGQLILGLKLVSYMSGSQFWRGIRFTDNGTDKAQIAINELGTLFSRIYASGGQNEYNAVMRVNGKRPGRDGNVSVPGADLTPVEERLDGLETQTTQLTTAVGAINDVLPQKYSASNPPPYPVASVNGAIGNVTVNTIYSLSGENDVTAAGLGDTAGICVRYKGNPIGYMYIKDRVVYVYDSTGGDPVHLYSPFTPPPYPVTSVNGKTGDVVVTGNVEKVSLTGTFSSEDAGYIITGVDSSKIINVHVPNYFIEWEGIANTLYVFVYATNSDGTLAKIDNPTLTFDVWRTT